MYTLVGSYPLANLPGSLQGVILEHIQVDSFSHYVPGTENKMIVPNTYIVRNESKMIASRCQQNSRNPALNACSGATVTRDVDGQAAFWGTT